jgi:hypothetical protein
VCNIRRNLYHSQFRNTLFQAKNLLTCNNMNKCNVCQKPSKSQCAKCHQTYYCSKECQKKNWKDHKKSCGEPSIQQSIADRTIKNLSSSSSSDNVLNKLFANMMSLVDKDTVMEDYWHVPDFEKEYIAEYPHEKQKIQFLESAKLSLKSLQLVEDFIDSDLDDGNDISYIVKRWGEWSEALQDFLISKRKIGDIFTKKTKNPYVGDRGIGALSFSNMPKQSLRFDQGKVHVAVGFVDLDLLLRGEIMQYENSEQPNKFIGYEGSVYAVAKTNVIVEMMMEKAPIRSIIEVWFSTVWTTETLKHFENAVKNVLLFGSAPNDRPPNPTKKELHPKVKSLISHWSKSVRSPKSRQEAHRLWAKTFTSEDSIFSIVANLNELRDRVQAVRYILTGEFPLMNDQQPKNLIASITMFNCNNGISPHSTSEFMFEMMPMDVILPKYRREDTAFLNAIYNFLEDAITKVCTWLSPPVGKTKMMEIYLHFQSVTNDNPALLSSIRRLNPWTMSWSNICDYFVVHDFHRLLRACSGNDTVHAMSSMNWYTEVFGAHIMEYKSSSRREILANAQKMVSMCGKFMDPSGYFQYTNIITHPYSIADLIATRKVKDYWQDYFFKGQQDLNIGDCSIVPFAQTHKTHTILIISFTYNKEINIRGIF